eukprot:1976182-Amphidinium_carterae.2
MVAPFTSVHGAEAVVAPSTPAAAISGRARSKLCGGWLGGALPQYSPMMTISVNSMLCTCSQSALLVGLPLAVERASTKGGTTSVR